MGLPVAIIGSGNIGTDLMIKMLRHGKHLEVSVMVGIDLPADAVKNAGFKIKPYRMADGREVLDGSGGAAVESNQADRGKERN